MTNLLRHLLQLGLTSLLFITISTHAQTRYVTDDFEIMMRTGPSIQNKIVRTLTSGDRMEVLREDAGQGHSQVQIGSGEIGFVLTRFISQNRSAKSRLASMQREVDELRSEPGQLRTHLANSQEENRDLIEQNLSLTDQLKSNDEELLEIKKAAGNAVEIAQQKESLETEVHQLLLQLDDIRIQNETLKDQSDRMDNLVGVGVLLVGLFFGWVLSISGRRRRNSWGS